MNKEYKPPMIKVYGHILRVPDDPRFFLGSKVMVQGELQFKGIWISAVDKITKTEAAEVAFTHWMLKANKKLRAGLKSGVYKASICVFEFQAFREWDWAMDWAKWGGLINE